MIKNKKKKEERQRRRLNPFPTSKDLNADLRPESSSGGVWELVLGWHWGRVSLQFLSPIPLFIKVFLQVFPPAKLFWVQRLLSFLSILPRMARYTCSYNRTV